MGCGAGYSLLSYVVQWFIDCDLFYSQNNHIFCTIPKKTDHVNDAIKQKL